MKILLVRTARMRQAITLGEFMFCEPIGLEGVTGVLKPRHAVRILDLMVEPDDAFERICATWRPDVVGITSLCVDVPAVLALARRAKRCDPAVVTVAGGTQAFLAPDSFKDPAVDHIFVYTTRANLTAFFDALDAGAPPPLDGVLSRARDYASTGVAGFNEMLPPDRTATAAYRAHYSYFGYRPCAIMQTSQGCARHCAFCLRWRIEGGVVRDRPLDEVVAEIRSIAEPAIMIFDNDLLHDGARLDALCDRLERAGVQKSFICYGATRSVLAQRAAVARFARLGLRAVLIGYESFSAADLAGYGKDATPDDNLAAAAYLRELGVDAWASFILHPDWDRADFRRFRRYVRALRPRVASLSPLTPFLPVSFFAPFEDRLLFPRADYERWSFSQVTIRPARLSLRRYYIELLKTNLYVNLYSNSLPYLVRKFGVGTVWRLLRGSLRIMGRYLALIRRADG